MNEINIIIAKSDSLFYELSLDRLYIKELIHKLSKCKK